MTILKKVLTVLCYLGGLKEARQTAFTQKQRNRSMSEEMLKKYEASMVLSGAGDALGFNNGSWEFCRSGEEIHAAVAQMGGLEKLDVTHFRVSDDTVMHIATAEALVEVPEGASLSELYSLLAQKYIDCMEDMTDRSPGISCLSAVKLLRPKVKDGWKIPFSKTGGGCGAAMRAMCVGLRFPHPNQQSALVAVSVDSGRMTHHHPTGYLGALASALFTAYAVRGKPVEEWGRGLLDTLEEAKQYVLHSDHFVEDNLRHWGYFENMWRDYLKERGILDGKAKARFPKNYDVKERDEFYKSVSYSGWGGSSGHDAPMIAYDGLLWAGNSWNRLAQHSFFHGGDSDSTATIAAAWWGALYGYKGVPKLNYEKLEYRDRLVRLAKELFDRCDSPPPRSSVCETSPAMKPDLLSSALQCTAAV
ncbi:ADP-ribosylarginine hydrolase isoform X1 [Arapaima gigas]